jgi:hypothetical protein
MKDMKAKRTVKKTSWCYHPNATDENIVNGILTKRKTQAVGSKKNPQSCCITIFQMKKFHLC